MRAPSSQKRRLDLAPPLADRFILGFPIDYGPVLLLMPFGSHFTVDTLPSGVQLAVASGQSWLCPAFAFVPV
jgi:TRAP-type mannitol/chloroaromatic compound transport system permease large subunit